jgi:hypothetical protein
MNPVRFVCGDASPEERGELKKDLGALDGTEIQDTGGSDQAALAEVIIVAIITAGAPIVYDAVKTFGKWLLLRRSREGQATSGSVRVTVEGLRASCTITITPETDTAQLDLAAVGTVTEIREAA